MSVKPIRPEEIVKSVPDAVIESFNELIAERISGREARVSQKDVVRRICQKMSLASDEIIFRNHWLDVESLYIAAGWDVKYDKPAYNETGEASFLFTRPNRA